MLEPLPVGTYEVSATLLDYLGAVVAETELSRATLEASGSDLELAFAEPGARVAATWSISQGGAPATCEAAGAARAELVLTNLDTGLGYGDTFDCPLGEGTGPWLTLGPYEAVVSLLYEQDVVLVSSDFMQVELDQADTTVDLPLVDFVLE